MRSGVLPGRIALSVAVQASYLLLLFMVPVLLMV